MSDKPKWTDLFGIDPTYDDTTERVEATRQDRTVRRQVAEEIAAALEAVDAVEWVLASQNAGLDAARIAREIGSREADG
jgi:hypothetical protein